MSRDEYPVTEVVGAVVQEFRAEGVREVVPGFPETSMPGVDSPLALVSTTLFYSEFCSIGVPSSFPVAPGEREMGCLCFRRNPLRVLR